LQRGGVGRSRAPGLAADPMGYLIRRSGLRPVGASDRAPGAYERSARLDRSVPRQRPRVAHRRCSPRHHRHTQGARLRIRDGFGVARGGGARGVGGGFRLAAPAPPPPPPSPPPPPPPPPLL